MRITADARIATRARILEVAKRLFREKGFDATTIRDIARAADLATGTLFNYFTAKEEVAVELAQEALSKAASEFQRKRTVGASLAEDLFLQLATQICALKPLRRFMQPILETALATPTLDGGTEASRRLRSNQLEAVGDILRLHRIDIDRLSLAVSIYWSLYVGALSFWSRDKSPKQEDTLAMLDQAMNMFVTWVEEAWGREQGAGESW